MLLSLANGSTHIWNLFGFWFLNWFHVNATGYQESVCIWNQFVRTEYLFLPEELKELVPNSVPAQFYLTVTFLIWRVCYMHVHKKNSIELCIFCGAKYWAQMKCLKCMVKSVCQENTCIIGSRSSIMDELASQTRNINVWTFIGRGELS